MNKLQKKYNNIVSEYVIEFEKRTELELDFWVITRYLPNRLKYCQA